MRALLQRPRDRQRKKRVKQILAGVGTVAMIATGLTLGTAMSASATHPTVTGSAVCDTSTGLSTITWRVSGDSSYPRETATIKYQSVATTPTLLEKTVQGTGYVEGVQSGLSAGEYSLKVKVQWTNHAKGDLVEKTGTVKIKADSCKIADKLDASASVSVTPATCTAPAKLVYGAIANATWSGTPDGTTGPGNYNVVANSIVNHKFPDGSTTKSFTGNLPGKDLSLCAPTEVTPVLTFTPGTCQVAGSVTAVETDTYKWTITGSQSARTYTAVPKGNVTLTQTVFGPYDMRQLSISADECQSDFTVEQNCKYVKITYNNNGRYDRWPDTRYSGDGVTGVDHGSGLTYTNVKVAAGTSKVIFEKTFDEDHNGGSVDVWYQDILGAERDIDIAAVKLVVKTDCEVNVLPSNPSGAIASECGSAMASVSNPFTPAANTVGTDATFTIEVDGVVKDTVTVAPGGAVETFNYAFDEDSGDHTVKIFSEGELISSAVVSTDCEATIITPIVPTITQATGKCVADTWKVTPASVTLLEVAGAQWGNYGQDKDGKVVMAKAGTFMFQLTAIGHSVVKDVNGFVNGAISVTIDKAPTAKNCKAAVPPAGTGIDGVSASSSNAGPFFTAGGIVLLIVAALLAMAYVTKRRTAEQ